MPMHGLHYLRDCTKSPKHHDAQCVHVQPSRRSADLNRYPPSGCGILGNTCSGYSTATLKITAGRALRHAIHSSCSAQQPQAHGRLCMQRAPMIRSTHPINPSWAHAPHAVHGNADT